MILYFFRAGCRARNRWMDKLLFWLGIIAAGKAKRATSPRLTAMPRERLRGWPYRTRTRKCRFFVISGELLGFTEHFRIRDFSRTPRRDRCKSRWVKATFASSSPICPATQSGLHRYLPERFPGQAFRVLPCRRPAD